ncbi:MAG: hypothetical protein WCO04_01420 [Pseudomonadota bacterium]|jgi:hypothetical protein
MGINEVILELSIALKKSLPIDNLITKYGIEIVSDAMLFIEHDNKETIEIEEDEIMQRL